MIKQNIKATNITITPAISDYIEKKVKMLEKFFGDKEALAMIEIGRTTRHHKTGDVFKAEIHIKSEGEDYYTASEKDDLYAAIDEAKDEISHAISLKKKKEVSRLRRGGRRIKDLIKGAVHFWPRKKS